MHCILYLELSQPSSKVTLNSCIISLPEAQRKVAQVFELICLNNAEGRIPCPDVQDCQKPGDGTQVKVTPMPDSHLHNFGSCFHQRNSVLCYT